ncbi:hypothetical protein PTKIN_Ptkin18bG0027800 [Pterospermum kingtungense]
MQFKSVSNVSASNVVSCPHWHYPPVGYFKCNIDASVRHGMVAIGLGLILRDIKGGVFAVKKIPCVGRLEVKEAEALGLLYALRWASDLRLEKVLFETVLKLFGTPCIVSPLTFLSLVVLSNNFGMFWL